LYPLLSIARVVRRSSVIESCGKPYEFVELIREVEAGLEQTVEVPAGVPVLPTGVPPHSGMEIGNGVGATAAPASEPDKT
jgi:hypothetical protein